LDVISSHQAGVKNVVACAGTALTTWHLKSLGRLSRNVRLCFDGDKAGVAATERAIGLAEPLDLKLSVVDWAKCDVILSEQSESKNLSDKKDPSAGARDDNAEPPKDPDEIIEKFGPEIWRKIVETSTAPAVDWVIEKYAADHDLTTADGKKELTTRALKLVRNLRDAVEIEFYLDKLARLTGVSLDALKQKMYSTTTEVKPRKNLKPIKSPRREYSRQTEQFFLNQIFAVAVKQPRLRSVLNNLPDEYLTKNFAELKYFLLDKTTEITPEMADKMAELEIIATRELAGDVDERLQMLNYLNELEKSKLRAKFDSLNSELASTLENESNDQNAARAKLLNGAVNGLKKDLTALEKTSARDDFAGLRQIWDGRKE
jgi:DNA primase